MIEIDGISEFRHYRDEAHLKYEVIRPVLLGQTTSRRRAQELQLNERTLTKYLGRFRNDGYAGLLDHRHSSSGRKEELSEDQQAYLIVLRLAYNGFSLRELAAIASQEHSIPLITKLCITSCKDMRRFLRSLRVRKPLSIC